MNQPGAGDSWLAVLPSLVREGKPYFKILLLFPISFVSKICQYVHLRYCSIYIGIHFPSVGQSMADWIHGSRTCGYRWSPALCHCINMNILRFCYPQGSGTNLPWILKGNCMAFHILYRQTQLRPPNSQLKLGREDIVWKVIQSYLILCDSMDCSSPGSFIHGVLQARIVEWVAIPFSRDRIQVWSKGKIWLLIKLVGHSKMLIKNANI